MRVMTPRKKLGTGQILLKLEVFNFCILFKWATNSIISNLKIIYPGSKQKSGSHYYHMKSKIWAYEENLRTSVSPSVLYLKKIALKV